MLNPVVVAEVLSTSTEAYDRGLEFAHYSELATLRAYVLVDVDIRRVEVFRPLGDDWFLTEFCDSSVVVLEVLELALPLDEVFAKVDLLDQA